MAPSTRNASPAKDFSLTFSHRVRQGSTTAKQYGLEIAKAAALPDTLLNWAKEATDKLSHLENSKKQNAEGNKVVRT